MTSSAARKSGDSSRDLWPRRGFAVHRPGIPEASPRSHGTPCRVPYHVVQVPALFCGWSGVGCTTVIEGPTRPPPARRWTARRWTWSTPGSPTSPTPTPPQCPPTPKPAACTCSSRPTRSPPPPAPRCWRPSPTAIHPECGAVVRTVLDALSAPAGAEDTRTQPQRYHDALHEAMQRLVTAGLLPDRAGQPVVAHISLADLMVLDGSSPLLEEWTANLRAQWAGHRAEASEGGSTGGAWLDGDAADAMACDAAMVPSSPGTSTPASWRIWSGCASSSTSSATTPAPARMTTPPTPASKRRPCRARAPRWGGKRSNARSSAKPRFSYCTHSECLSCGDSGSEARTIVLSSRQP